MASELYEVAFSGQISEGADLQEVKARVGKMFKADGQKLEQLFSGQRIVIKRNVDEVTAQKYQSALRSAGAESEVRSTSTADTEVAATPTAPPAVVAAPAAAPAAEATGDEPSAQPAPLQAPPSTDPLGITADQINDLDAGLAPVGAELQDETEAVSEPEYDLSALEMAPVGSTLSEEEHKPPPSLPDTSGLSLAD